MVTNDEIRAEKLPTAHDVAGRLLIEHKPGQFVYRGQVTRYQKHKFHIAFEGGQVEVENMYPSDFRFITNYTGTELGAEERITAARETGRDRRDEFERFILSKALSGLKDSDPRYAWLSPHVAYLIELLDRIQRQAEASSRTFQEIVLENKVDLFSFASRRITWSLAQHYFIATALTDVTFDPEVAIWFATHEWETDKSRPVGGTGVIYRFDRAKLEFFLSLDTELRAQWASLQALVPAPTPFLEDIRSIPESFAKRPRGQQGGSIYGLDSPVAVHLVFKHNICEALEFRHTYDPPELKVCREVIAPEDDPFLELLREFQASLASANILRGNVESR